MTAMDIKEYGRLPLLDRRAVDDWLRAHDLLDKHVVSYEVVGDTIRAECYQQSKSGAITYDGREFKFEWIEVPLRQPPPEVTPLA